MKLYNLREIGFEESIETSETLISVAYEHAKETERPYEHITTVENAITYFNEHGFEVREVTNFRQFVVISVINREISTDFFNDMDKAKEKMLDIYNSYLDEEEQLDQVDYGRDEHECWISGIYNNVDIAIHEVL